MVLTPRLLFLVLFSHFLWPTTCKAELDLIWQKRFGGSKWEYAESIAQAQNGDLLLAGGSESVDGHVSLNIGSFDLWIIRTTSTGVPIWEKNMGGKAFDIAYSVLEAENGDILIAGMTESSPSNVSASGSHGDAWIIRLDHAGEMIWEQTYGGTSEDAAHQVVERPDGSLIVIGSTRSNDGDVQLNQGGADAWIFALDSDGELIWEHTYGGSEFDQVEHIHLTENREILIAGSTQSADEDIDQQKGEGDAWVLRLDHFGKLLWTHTYGGSRFDAAYDILEAKNGDILIAGETESWNGDVHWNYGLNDFWICRLNAVGDLLWERNLGGSWQDQAQAIIEGADGRIVVAGISESADEDLTGNSGGADYWVVQLTADGNVLDQQHYGGSGQEQVCGILESKDGGLIIAGDSHSVDGDVMAGSGSLDFWMIKLELSVDDRVENDHSLERTQKIAEDESKPAFLPTVSNQLRTSMLNIRKHLMDRVSLKTEQFESALQFALADKKFDDEDFYLTSTYLEGYNDTPKEELIRADIANAPELSLMTHPSEKESSEDLIPNFDWSALFKKTSTSSQSNIPQSNTELSGVLSLTTRKGLQKADASLQTLSVIRQFQWMVKTQWYRSDRLDGELFLPN